MIKRGDIHDIFKQKYGKATLQVASPGRANIIGEHTDYNDGYVLPFAINKRIYFSAAPNNDDCFNIYAFNLNKELTVYPNQKWEKGFARFFSSVLETFNKYDYPIAGLNIVFGGDLPIGGGMSSSSSVTCGFIALLNQQFSLGLSKIDMVKLAVESEHGIGVEGGNMDQYSIIHGETDKAILLDCMAGTSELIDIELGDKMFCLFNTNVSHNLQDTEYNTRSRTCKAAKEKIKLADAKVKNYRDVGQQHLSILDEVEKKRVTHVIAENKRVFETVQAFSDKELHKVGSLLNASHDSLRDLYEVSCAELDFLQSRLITSDQVLGARMMGGGFGGCVIALLASDSLKDIALSLEEAYKSEFDLPLDVYPIKPEIGLTVREV